jgi:hypothetical protein
VTNGPHVVSLWKLIRNGWKRFSILLKYEVGSGSRTHFWLDLWYGDVTFKEVFPPLFRIAENREAYVADYLCWHNGFAHWDFLFTRSVHDYELVSL